MKQEILARFEELGGDVGHCLGGSLREQLQAIKFRNPLYHPDVWGVELYGLDEFCVEHLELFSGDKERFYQELLQHFFSMLEEPCGQMFFDGTLFTPFKANTPDFEEWNGYFSDEGCTDLSVIYDVCPSKEPEFIKLFSSNGFPDSYYICLSDRVPDNPTVFGTDHEVFFREVSNEGTLEDFLGKFYSKIQFLEVAKACIESEIMPKLLTRYLKFGIMQHT